MFTAKAGTGTKVKAKIIRAKDVIKYIQRKKRLDHYDYAERMYRDALERTRRPDNTLSVEDALTYLGLNINEVKTEDRGVICGSRWEVFKSKLIYKVRSVIKL